MPNSQVFTESAFREFLAQLQVAHEEWARYADRAPAGLTGHTTEADMRKAVRETWEELHNHKKLIAVEMAYYCAMFYLEALREEVDDPARQNELYRKTIQETLEHDG